MAAFELQPIATSVTAKRKKKNRGPFYEFSRDLFPEQKTYIIEELRNDGKNQRTHQRSNTISQYAYLEFHFYSLEQVIIKKLTQYLQ